MVSVVEKRSKLLSVRKMRNDTWIRNPGLDLNLVLWDLSKNAGTLVHVRCGEPYPHNLPPNQKNGHACACYSYNQHNDETMSSDADTGGAVGEGSGSSILLNQPIVIDNGTSSIKAGFAGSSKPKVSGNLRGSLGMLGARACHRLSFVSQLPLPW